MAGALGSVPGPVDWPTMCGLWWHRDLIRRARADELAAALDRVRR